MSWLQKISLRITPLSYTGGLIHVFIDKNEYWYESQPATYRKLKFYCDRGWFGKAMQVLGELPMADGPNLYQ